MKVSAAIWDELRGEVFAAARAGIDTQRAIADELDRRAGTATGKRREKLARAAVSARERAAAQEKQIAGVAGGAYPVTGGVRALGRAGRPRSVWGLSPHSSPQNAVAG